MCTLQNQASTLIGVDEISDPSGNEISDIGAENVENTNVPSIKACKSIKAGEKAQQETINFWKENGFSR